jgi:hypothetical protein
MMKSNNSNALPIDAAATARQAWCGGSANPMPMNSPDLDEDDSDRRQADGDPLHPADWFAQYEHCQRAAEDDATLAQGRNQADGSVHISPDPA